MQNLDSSIRGGTACFSKAGLGIGSTGSQVKIAAPNGAGVDFAINGIMYHKADAASVAITADDEQANGTYCIYLVCLNAAGTLSTVKGNDVDTTSFEAGAATAAWPTPEDDTCPIGAVVVKAGGSATFTAGTTALSATGITDTYLDFFAVPTKPLKYSDIS